MSVSADLLDIMQKYNWQIVDRQYIEVIPNERENAWKDLLILALRTTPQTFRSNLRKGLLDFFDFKQPIYYDLERRQLGISTESVINALTPPRKAMFNSKLISPLSIVTGFILVLLSYLVVEGKFF
ncbi:unknown [Choristoneura occidentalis granulovirus]|uniref:Pif-6 n=1 Tax=Choristoneura occidentalis granulovirus TaxID=364745 RepID=Q1A4K3_9BBAC|nr:unknown [Choristoneura fumiferana granulovirus]ABC61227.1 unknown [Choristoneura fumiferana granulovirus]